MFSPQHPRRRANIIIIFSSCFFFCSIFPIFHTKTVYTPHKIQMVYIITYAYNTVDITVLCSCRVLASMCTHYNTILCSRVNLTGKAHYYLLLRLFFFFLVRYSTISILINPTQKKKSTTVYNVTFESVY